MFVEESTSPLNGTPHFRAHGVIPPGKVAFLQKVRLIGNFVVASGHFTRTSTQENVDSLSEKARRVKRNDRVPEEDPEREFSNLAGHVELRDATAAFGNLSFNVPGAFAQMHGTNNLQSEAVDLHGTLKTDAKLSEMNRGFKSVVLKPFDVFFKRKHAGGALPVLLIGTYHALLAGLDFPVRKSSAKLPAAN